MQVVVDEGLAKPILVGRPAVIERRLSQFGLRLKPGVDFEIINPESDPRYRDYWMEYYRLTERKGTSQQFAKIEMRRRLTLIGAMMIHMGHADGMLCGMFGTHDAHRHYVDQVIGLRAGVKTWAAMNAVLLPSRTVFIADTYVNRDPTAEQIAGDQRGSPRRKCEGSASFPRSRWCPIPASVRATIRRQEKCSRRSRSSTRRSPSSRSKERCRETRRYPMRVRRAAFPNSRLKGDANLLIMPTLDAANISFNLLKVAAGSGLTLGPILLGRRQAGAHSHPVGDRAAHRQHERAGSRRRHRRSSEAAALAQRAARSEVVRMQARPHATARTCGMSVAAVQLRWQDRIPARLKTTSQCPRCREPRSMHIAKR